MEKNLSAVEKYALEDKLKFLRGMCFNNAAVLLSSRKYENITLTAENVFDLAEKLFDEGVRRKYYDYGKVEDNRTIIRETGIVAETPSSAVGGVPVTLTEKETKEMIENAKNDETLVI